ncbi:hypothetical protein VST63_04730 [Mycolicibacterium sp. 050232]|uniref:hypothetical protein n=1 Tax=Mycolicibacterium sp. 050232 TaxID=3113982 RepID=UPI002E2E2FC8|nr:hypothetical protein [Mycolicibacterium sp. 050232]MED5811656.1 hypothetical protein [Mycolicibacterium sp. 050232]
MAIAAGCNIRRNTLALCVVSAAITLAGCVSPDRVSKDPADTPRWNAGLSSSTPSPAAVPPTAADFVVGVVITEQKCFGSAGCSYRYTINPQYLSTKPLPDKTTVIFKVTGGDQDQVGNFTIDADGTATFDREAGISGPEDADLRATVTQVLPGRSTH